MISNFSLLVGYLVIGPLTFIPWFHRAYSNLPRLGFRELRYAPGWAIGSWFVPILNLWRPKQIANDIYRGSDPAQAPGSNFWKEPITPLLGWWWGLFIGGRFVEQLGVTMALERKRGRVHPRERIDGIRSHGADRADHCGGRRRALDHRCGPRNQARPRCSRSARRRPRERGAWPRLGLCDAGERYGDDRARSRRRDRRRRDRGRARGATPARRGGPRRRWRETAAVVERLAASDEPAYGISTGFGSLAQTAIAPERRVELQRALIRSHAAGMGEPVEREVVRAMIFLRARSLAMGRSGARPVLAETMLAMLEAGISPRGPRARLARRQRRPRAARALRAGADRRGRGASTRTTATGAPRRGAGRGRDRAAGARPEGGPRADQRHRRHPRDARPRARRPRRAAARRRRRRGDDDRGAPRHRSRLCRRPGRAAPAARPGRKRREPARGCSPARRSSPAIARTTRGSRTPTRSAARPRSTAPPATPAPTSSRWPPNELVSAIDNPMVLPDGRVESCGNFHGAPVAIACDFLAIAAADVGAISERRTDRLLDASALAGAAAVPRPRRRRQLRADDRPVHAGGDGRREPAPGQPGLGRLAADERDAGGSRLDGLGCGAQAATSVANLRRILAVEITGGGAGDRAAGAARAGRRHRGRGRGRARGRGPGARARPLARARARRGRRAAARAGRCSTAVDG